MKKTLLQKISNILFYITFIFSWYIASIFTFSPWEDFSTLLNFLIYAVLFLSGFFHYISYKYNSARTLSTILIIAFGTISAVFAILNSGLLNIGKLYATDIFNFLQFIFAVAFLLIFHFVSCGRFDGEIKIHEFNIKMEDGRYEKVTIKEKISNKSSQIDAKTIIKKLLKTILILFLILLGLLIAWGTLIIIDSEANLKRNIKALPTEIVSQEYLDEFNLNDYERLDFGSRYLGLTLRTPNCYYNNGGEYIFASEPTRIISESNKADENTYWQMGNNKNLIMNLVDEDWGSYSRAYYLNKNCVFPDENDKIVKVIAEFDKELKFNEKQLSYIKNSIKNFDSDIITKPESEFLNEYESLDDYALVFCFEGFDDIYLTCCSIVKDKSGQWYLYKDYYKDHYDKEVIFYDLEELPQDICDTINESLK